MNTKKMLIYKSIKYASSVLKLVKILDIFSFPEFYLP